MISDKSTVLGWTGGIKAYGGNVWELPPLVVHQDHRRKGIGRALVADLEALIRERGGLALWLSTDDEDRMTSLGGKGLFQDTLKHLAEIRNLRNHPYEFYQKVGFTIVGVVPGSRPGQARHPDGQADKQTRQEPSARL